MTVIDAYKKNLAKVWYDIFCVLMLTKEVDKFFLRKIKRHKGRELIF
jgi:hypothetical protein